MNPSGIRMDEKKTADSTSTGSGGGLLTPLSMTDRSHGSDSKSTHSSYRSTHSSRSSVLERAREYNRRIADEQRAAWSHHNNNSNDSNKSNNSGGSNNRRSKSLERTESSSEAGGGGGGYAASGTGSNTTPRSQSAGRMASGGFPSQQNHSAGNRPSTRERAMASVRNEPISTQQQQQQQRRNMTQQQQQQVTQAQNLNNSNSNHSAKHTSSTNKNGNRTIATATKGEPATIQQQQQQNLSPASTSQYSRGTSAVGPGAPAAMATAANHNRPQPTAQGQRLSEQQHQQQQQQLHLQATQQQQTMSQPTGAGAAAPNNRMATGGPSRRTSNDAASRMSANSRPSLKSHAASRQSPTDSQQQDGELQQQHQQPVAVVTPELLVDALSGHEDGLLAIAERLMEHYDAGYDVMGEAIIDAFADVQKLFQHVVEAAHMEGAAFEASRREAEMAELKKQQDLSYLTEDPPAAPAGVAPPPGSPSHGPARHDEFIDQDVKDVLTEAIRKGTALREANQHMECFELYEQACQSASALLPVDSDHRGRLQLSIARAESMSADRACAILRYAMDDVLRSGLRAGKTPLPDPSKRADVVLQRPKGQPSLTGVSSTGGAAGLSGTVQSSEEALNSLMEEMKEILNAPVYHDNTPLQAVSGRFWTALADNFKAQQKNAERLEQSLGKLKGDFLLARAEWEEKLNQTTEMAENYKNKYERLKEQMKPEQYMDHARSMSKSMNLDDSHDSHHNNTSHSNSFQNDVSTIYGSVKSAATGRAGSVASLGSGLAQHAKTLVNTMNSFNCTALNDRNVMPNDDMDDQVSEVGHERHLRHGRSDDSSHGGAGGHHPHHRRGRSRTQSNQQQQQSSSSYHHRGSPSSSSKYQSSPTDQSRSSVPSGISSSAMNSSSGIHKTQPSNAGAGSSNNNNGAAAAANTKNSRSFQSYNRSPQRIDV